MISPSVKSMAESSQSSNFFLQSATDSTSINPSTAALIQPILQDAHALQKLADAHNINHFLNESTPVADDKTVSAMANLANNISQALHNVVHQSTAIEPSSARSNQPPSKVQRRQKTTVHAPRSKSHGDSGEPKKCSFCGVKETPRWRYISSGCITCNVCGLVQSRRCMRKYLESARRTSSSDGPSHLT